jgi:hypothetical protein
VAWRSGALCAAVMLALFPGAVSAANSDCSCVPDNVLPGGKLAALRNVAIAGKASTLTKSVAVRLKAEDVTPGSCTTGESSDPVTLSLLLEDDDGDVILNAVKPGFVCTSGETTYAKFTARFEGPKNCKDSLAPAQQPTQGDLFATATTDDGSLMRTRQILCKSDTATPTPTPTPPTPTPTPTPSSVVFNLTPAAHYHVTLGDTLNIAVTAMTTGGSPLGVTASGLPPGASFDGTNFSWVGAFADLDDNGRHDVTFMAGGDSTQVVIGTTEFAVLAFALVDPATGVPFPGNLIPIPIGGRQNVWAQALCNPFNQGHTPFCGQGTNGWANFGWSILDPAVADFFSVAVTAAIDGLANGMTPIEARYTDADPTSGPTANGDWRATATLDVQ